MSLSGISRFAIVLGIAAFTFSGCGEVAEENEDNEGGLTKYLSRKYRYRLSSIFG